MLHLASIKNQINDFRVFNQELKNLPKKEKVLIQTVNQYSYCITKEDPEFKAALMGADVLLPDGIGIVMANRLISGAKVKKIAGADLHQHLLEELNIKGGKCFYLGSSVKTLEAIKARSEKEYSNIEVGYYSPPFKANFDQSETQEMIDAVNEFQPDVLFIGMTAPKQEKWAFANKEFLNAPVICSIGAVFDFYAGTVERPSQFWVNLGLEWLVRLAKEPKRMWVRYGYYGPIFVKDMLMEYVNFQLASKLETGQYVSMKESHSN